MKWSQKQYMLYMDCVNLRCGCAIQPLLYQNKPVQVSSSRGKLPQQVMQAALGQEGHMGAGHHPELPCPPVQAEGWAWSLGSPQHDQNLQQLCTLAAHCGVCA